MSSFHSKAGSDKEVMEEDYQKALKLISLMVTGVVCLNKTSIRTNQRFQMVCMNPPTHSP